EGGAVKTTSLNILSGFAFVAVIGALLFGSAGRWDLPLFWAYLGVWAAAAVPSAIVIGPTPTKGRPRPGPGGKDYLILFVIPPIWLGLYVVAGLDVGRFHWSDDVPLPLQVVALAVMAAALAVMVWALAVNRFFSSVVRIQAERGHHVITG